MHLIFRASKTEYINLYKNRFAFKHKRRQKAYNQFHKNGTSLENIKGKKKKLKSENKIYTTFLSHNADVTVPTNL
jgi:hypothetical protein